MEDKFFVGANKGLNIVLSLVMLALLLYVSLLYSEQVARQEQYEKNDLFQRVAAQASDLLREKVKPFPVLLRSARGVVLGHEDISPANWSRFINSMGLDYQSLGIIGLTYTESVFDFQLLEYLQKRGQRFNNFRIFPEGVREEYMVVLYLAPEALSERIRGFDISVEERRREAALNARETGKLTMTRPISLLPTEAHSLDYLLLLPVYGDGWRPDMSLREERAGQFKGWTTLGFSMSRLAAEVIKEIDKGLRLQLFDARTGDKPIFDSSPAAVDSEIDSSGYQLNAVLSLGGQALTVRITPLPGSVLADVLPDYDRASLISGSVISLLVSVVLFLLLSSRFTAVRMASSLLEQFAESETRYKALFELSPEAVIIHRKGRILLVNKAALKLLKAKSPGLLIGRHVMDYVHDESKEIVLERMSGSGDEVMPFVEERLLRCDGTDFLAEVSGAFIQFEGEPAVQIMFRDISGEQETRFEAQLSRAVFRHSHEPMMVTDADGVISLVNPAFTEVTGFDADDVQGENASVLSSGYHDDQFYEQMWQHLQKEGEWEGEMTNRRKDGKIYIQRAHISAIRGLHGDITQFICVMSDITEQKKELENIRFQAMHDPLTRLPNRVLFTSEVRKAVASSDDHQSHFAVLFMDLDGFKPVNDTYGHLLGDKLLIALARKLSGAVKQQDLIARVGGDEFLVLLKDIEDDQQALAVAERLIALICEPIVLDGHELHLGASIGIAVYPEYARDELTLIDKADKAMYQVKRSGKGRALLADKASDLPVESLSVLQ
ncbi:sensor domain-containing diguanylate cyclase [Oceanospirillum sediminis]|uniref:Diguanylate cyclase n=1 Tax=Oceanospirillum sediminis TaxID=2760088 RepID=A0A839IRF9_9GAMM|nr:diguanylate cyclase [Oceanospirillum sediminis]MBB1487027.1 diguanylate cyclase [Oceanospirillum sediminis]